MSSSTKKHLVLFIYVALILNTLLVYWQVHNFDFVSSDDAEYVYRNPYVLNGLNRDGIVWAFTTSIFGYWQPLTWVSLMLDCKLFGPDPGAMHLINVILHLANTLLLLAVLRKMTGSLWSSAFVAAAFALHPMHVESVAWIAERKDVLSTLFLLLTLAAYAGYVRRPTVYRYVTSLLLFAFGLMAKPMLVTLPFLLLLLDYWPLNRFDSQHAKTSGCPPCKPGIVGDRHTRVYKIVIEKIPFFVLSAISSFITFLTQQSDGNITYVKTISMKDRVGNALLSYSTYIEKIFWPQDLAVFYPFRASGSITPVKFILYALLMVGVSFLVYRTLRSRKYLLVGWLWFVGTLVPVIGLVQFTVSPFADRYTYIPYTGLFIMIAWGLPDLISRWPLRKIALGLSMAIVLASLGICAHRQVSHWSNSVTLFEHAIEVTQDNYIAQNDLAWLIATDPMMEIRDTGKAIRLANRACELVDYRDPSLLDTLAAAYASAGKFSDAVATANKALDIADAAKQPRLKDIIQHHLYFYRQGKPYIEPVGKLLADPNKP